MTDDTNALTGGIMARIAALYADRERLPCYQPQQAGNLGAAVDACESKGAQSGCQFAEFPDCARMLEAAPRDLARERMASAGVPEVHAARLLGAMPRRLRVGARGPDPLEPTDALRLVRAFLQRRPQSVPLDCSETVVTLTGAEWILVLGGSVGVGKSLAASWAIRERGGAFLRARDLSGIDPGPVTRAEVAAFLVLDDVGEEHRGESDWGPQRIAGVLAERHAGNLLTIVTTNLGSRADFSARYGQRLDDRIRDRGKWIALTGRSMRGAS